MSVVRLYKFLNGTNTLIYTFYWHFVSFVNDHEGRNVLIINHPICPLEIRLLSMLSSRRASGRPHWSHIYLLAAWQI